MISLPPWKMMSCHTADLSLDISTGTGHLRPSQLLLVGLHPDPDNAVREQAKRELARRRSTAEVSASRHRSEFLRPSALLMNLPSELRLSFFPAPGGLSNPLSGALTGRASDKSLINRGWVTTDGVDLFNFRQPKLGGEKKRSSSQLSGHGEGNSRVRKRVRHEVKAEVTPAAEDATTIAKNAILSPSPHEAEALPSSHHTPPTSTHAHFTPSVPSPTTDPPTVVRRDHWEAAPFVSTMSFYLISRPPPPPFSCAHQNSIVAFMKFCEPTWKWSRLPRQRVEAFETERIYDASLDQVHRCTLDIRKARKLPCRSTPEQPQGVLYLVWTSLSVVIDWLWGGSDAERWDQTRWIMLDTKNEDVYNILKLYASQYRYRLVVLKAWRDLSLYLESFGNSRLDPHLRRARLLVRYLDGIQCLEGHETRRDWFFSDAEDTTHETPWISWFSNLSEDDDEILRRLGQWEGEERRWRTGKDRRQES